MNDTVKKPTGGRGDDPLPAGAALSAVAPHEPVSVVLA
ncbi:hypothetical protein, partial [Mycobacterium avium]